MMMFPPLATGPFFSLGNSDFIVTLGFLVFIGILIYFKVPGLLGGMLDKRAVQIQSELEQARDLREEAQTLLASFERKQKQVQDQAAAIVSSARAEAEDAAKEAHEQLAKSMERRLQAATDQIQSAEAAAVRQVKDQAVSVAMQAAASVMKSKMGDQSASAMIDDAIREVGAKLH